MNPFVQHSQWPAVNDVAKRLVAKGFQAMLAGGCVRDSLLGRTPGDFDIATDATPDQVAALFDNAIEVGRSFGVIIIPFDGFQIEIATFREEAQYSDGRRPDAVKFSSAQADAARRDFTMNALFYDIDKQKIIDFVDGVGDINRRLIRAVGEASRRFEEDKLRLMRAVRFVAQLGFDLDPATHAAVVEHAAQLPVVSRERLRDELQKLLKASGRAVGLRLLQETGLLKSAWPDIALSADASASWVKNFEFASQRTRAFEDQPFDERVLWLALFYLSFWQFDEKRAISSLRNDKIDNHSVDQIRFVLQKQSLLRQAARLRRGEWLDIIFSARKQSLLNETCLVSQVGENRQVGAVSIAWLHDVQQAVKDEHEGRIVIEPFLSGADLQSFGLKPSPSLGRQLREAYLLQLEGQFANREQALGWASRISRS